MGPDADPGGPRTYGSYGSGSVFGSGSATLFFYCAYVKGLHRSAWIHTKSRFSRHISNLGPNDKISRFPIIWVMPWGSGTRCTVSNRLVCRYFVAGLDEQAPHYLGHAMRFWNQVYIVQCLTYWCAGTLWLGWMSRLPTTWVMPWGSGTRVYSVQGGSDKSGIFFFLLCVPRRLYFPALQ